jgi:predicted secreted protein
MRSIIKQRNGVILTWLILFAGWALINATCSQQAVEKKLTEDNSGGKLTLAGGQAFSLTLPDHVDGGFRFNKPQYDSTVIHLQSYVSNSPDDKGRVGHSGTGVWLFTAIGKGKTILKVTSSRPWKPTDSTVVFQNIVLVK